MDPEKYNISVVDSSGNKYVDAQGVNNYKVFVERYSADKNNISMDFYRIIILLDLPNPVNLYLVYDKYEKNSDGIPFDQFLGYKEYINTVPVYDYVVEESEVIDPSSKNKRVYSTQFFSYKEKKLLKSNTNDEGWKIVTPKKSIQDPRTFQNFNWRIISKINYDFSKNKNIKDSSQRAMLKVAVLYSGSIENAQNPYVFANLEESVINQQNFIFENPLATGGSNINPLATAGFNKNERQYWLLNIEDFLSTQVSSGNADAFSYDFLVWTPNSAITQNQKRTIDMFLSNGVSVMIDCSGLDQSSLGLSGLSNFDFPLVPKDNNTGIIKIVDDYVNGDESLNGWDMSAYNENLIKEYGIFGDRKNILNNNSVNKIRVFDGLPNSSDGSAQSIAYIRDSGVDYSAILKDKYNVNSDFSAFSIFCANPFLTFINDNYGGSGIPISGKNNGPTNTFPTGRAGSQTGFLSEAVIGPNKMFYNIICESNKNKVNSKEKYSDESVIVWNVSPWRNSWTINGKPNLSGDVDVLFDDEKRAFKFSHKAEEQNDEYTTQSLSTIFCREINSSVGELFIQDFEATSNQVDSATMINADYSNVDFYLECTNDNVKFLNFSKIDSNNYLFGNTKTSYTIYKLSSSAKTTMETRPLTLDAYSEVYSRQFNLSSIYYPYIILDYSDYLSQVSSAIKTPTDYLPGSQFVRDYDFKFKTQLFVTEVKSNRYNYEVKWSTPFTVSLNGESSSITVKTSEAIAELPDGSSAAVYGAYEAEYQPIPVRNNESPFNLYRYPTNVFSATDILYRNFSNRAHTRNNFHYTNDLPITKYWDEYMLGKNSSTAALGQDTIVTETTYTATPSSNDSTANEKVILKLHSEGRVLWDKLVEDQVIYGWADSFPATKISLKYSNLHDAFLRWEGSNNNFYSALQSRSNWSLYVKKFATQSPAEILHMIYKNVGSTILVGTENDSVGAIARDLGVKTGDLGTDINGPLLLGLLFKQFLIFNRAYTATPTTSTRVITASNVVSDSSGMPSSYIAYVQYTMSNSGVPTKITGKYDSVTAAAVRQFQSNKKQGLVDGIVDSETKSVLAITWLNLYKYDRSEFERLKKQAPDGVARFIDAAVLYSDISNAYDGSNSSEYRRISYTRHTWTNHSG